MDAAQRVELNTLGMLGLDLRSGLGDVEALRCAELQNVDIVPPIEGFGGRVQPRRTFRRWGQRGWYLTVADNGAGALTGLYYYAYRYTDAAGRVHESREAYWSGSSQQSRVSGWPTVAGSVTIYRTTAGGSTYKALAGPLNVATNAYYDDNTADGSLGADRVAAAAAVDPLGNDSFDQTALCDFLAAYSSKDEEDRVLAAFTRSDGLAGAGVLNWGYFDQDEIMRATAGESSLSDEPAGWALLNDQLWLARGGTSLKYRTTTGSSGFATAGQPSQPTLSASSQVAGALSAATGHSYVVQVEDTATGIRSIPSDPLAFAGPYTNKKNQFTISSAGSNKRYHVYRTSDGGDLFQFVETAAAGAYTDEMADAELSQETVSFDVGAPPGAKYLVAHKGVLFALHHTGASGTANLQPNKIGWSNAALPVNFVSDPITAADYELLIDADDGDEITGAVSWGETLVIFKRRKVYLLLGDPPTEFRFAPINGSEGLGCVAARSIVQTPAGLFWLSPAGVVRMAEPGAPPVLISSELADELVEAERRNEAVEGHALETDPAGFEILHANKTTAGQTLHFRVQLDTDPAFASVDYDYDTETGGERGYFRADGAEFPSGGVAVGVLGVVRVAVFPPTSGPAAGTSYSVRYAVKSGASWGAWTTLGEFRRQAETFGGETINWARIPWAFAVHYAPREEIWLALPSGDRVWCDRIYRLGYGAMARGNGPPVWSLTRFPCTAGCAVPAWALGGEPTQDYVLLASPDGLLFAYPWLAGGYDADTRATVSVRSGSGTLAGATLTLAGAGWPTTQYGLAGSVAVVRDADGRSATAIITANTATTLTLVWLGGASVLAGAVTVHVGGLDVAIRSGWLALGGEAERTAIVLGAWLNTGPARASLDVTLLGALGPSLQIDRVGGRRRKWVAVGGGRSRLYVPQELRGRVHALRIATQATPALWELESVTLALRPTGSRT